MNNESVKMTVVGCLVGLIGACLGVLIGGMIGGIFTDKPDKLVPIGDGIQMNVNAFSWVPGMLFGAGIGGIIGAIGGSVFGAGLVAKRWRTVKEERPFVDVYRPGTVSERSAESDDEELARLKERVAELEAKKQMDDRFKAM
jgi:hypothetical protein